VSRFIGGVCRFIGESAALLGRVPLYWGSVPLNWGSVPLYWGSVPLYWESVPLYWVSLLLYWGVRRFTIYLGTLEFWLINEKFFILIEHFLSYGNYISPQLKLTVFAWKFEMKEQMSWEGLVAGSGVL
jgi:hypothetical protein